MKKITLALTLITAFAFNLSAQEISFEISEGYELGNIYGQNNWETTDNENGGFIENQIITDELASNGNYSLKLNKEPDLPGKLDPYIGAFYNYSDPVSMDDTEFSADLYFSEQDPNNFNFLMALVDITESRYRTYINFFFDGSINVFVKGGPTGIQVVYTGHNWEKETWYNVKIKTVGEDVKFYINGEVIYEGTSVSVGQVDQLRFVHDNYEGSAYIDNFKTNSQPLAISSFETTETISHFYNSEAKILSLKSNDARFSGISIFNVLGQNVLNKNLSNSAENINLERLNDGVYIVKLNMANATKTFKILKQ
ncbi:T9SS type A sorting domain-containing protein [Aequorivita marina]|uniref:T9SS type A sorting domain-containing protein n=1 Tax=Aequorivita marina TaxID=3073654 RepID=UPI00287416E9|nr:T9SS type A sorting domain-containing protein [Aequorivita sp. S2608]MDS1299654.1 T9SS type A sorting domain-containing protein [Aequorivita sp. S2608]